METPNRPEHPESAAEAAHLARTRAIILREIALMEKDTGVGAEEECTVAVPADATADEQVVLDVLRLKLDRLHCLGLASRQAYFARLDFIPAGGKKETHYLGRWGVTSTPDFDTVVVDWRSPVANLYYSGQVGPMSYDAPDGRIRGELTLKRMLEVRDDRLLSIFDSGVVSQDAYLQGVLGAVSTDRLREIVTTIQAEQNLVIRHPLNRSLIVQGAAGSGKTTIALHRIAYLLYAYRDTLRPEQMLILAPSPLFLSYISQVLPDLGVERVRQSTFAGLCGLWLGRKAPRVRAESRLEWYLGAGPEARAAAGAVLRRKGSLAFKRDLEAFLSRFQEEMLPAEGLVFGGRTLMDAAEVREVFLRQLAPFPAAARITEMRKYVRRRLATAGGAMKDALASLAQERLTQLLARLPDGPERRERAGRLLASRDARVKEIDERAETYLKDFPRLFPDLSPVAVYRQYLVRCESGEVAAATVSALDAGYVRNEDLAPLVSICRVLWGLRADVVKHVVMDECQDFSPYQLALLRDAYPAATFTLVGDLTQGIHADEGIADYAQWTGPVFRDAATLLTLANSYRSTVEIMTLAARVAARYPLPGIPAAQPVLRHGETPSLNVFPTAAERDRAILAQARAWMAEGFHTVALITRGARAAAEMNRRFGGELSARLVTEADRDYRGGVLILPVALVKGLEFDCVAVCDAEKDVYPDEAFFCRVLYVLTTRPLHRLALFSAGEPTALLNSAK